MQCVYFVVRAESLIQFELISISICLTDILFCSVLWGHGLSAILLSFLFFFFFRVLRIFDQLLLICTSHKNHTESTQLDLVVDTIQCCTLIAPWKATTHEKTQFAALFKSNLLTFLVHNGNIGWTMAETDPFTEAGKRKHFITYAKSPGLI
jgi:hypothetical protein